VTRILSSRNRTSLSDDNWKMAILGDRPHQDRWRSTAEGTFKYGQKPHVGWLLNVHGAVGAKLVSKVGRFLM
jgi:hypothetical protein